MPTPLSTLARRGDFTTSAPEDQPLDVLDPATGRVKSLSDLARGSGGHRTEGYTPRAWKLNLRHLGRIADDAAYMMGGTYSRDELNDTLLDNPDWDEHDVRRWVEERGVPTDTSGM